VKIYVASSWRNTSQPDVVTTLRRVGHEVYDFRNPVPDHAFHWSEIDPDWQRWNPVTFREALEHPIARAGYASDMAALESADAVILILPCGRSAHLELGYAVGRGQHTAILLGDSEPELMYRMADCLAISIEEVIDWLARCRDGGYPGAGTGRGGQRCPK